MNLLNSRLYLAKNILTFNKFDTNLLINLNKRLFFTFRNNQKCNQLVFSSQKPQLFHYNNNEIRHRFDPNLNLVIIRSFAKGKDKQKHKIKGGKPKIILTDDEMQEVIPMTELKVELNKVIDELKEDFVKNINVRSNPSTIENLIVSMDGSKFTLSEIANISRKSPQLVVLNLSSIPDAIKPVLAAINDSGMNINPQQEGTVIYLPIPKVTREHREGLAKNAKTLCQRAKDQLKDIHSSFSTYVKKQKKGNVSEELIFNINENLKYLIDSKIAECDHMLEQKINDLLK